MTSHCIVIFISELLRRPIERLQSYSLVLNVSYGPRCLGMRGRELVSWVRGRVVSLHVHVARPFLALVGGSSVIDYRRRHKIDNGPATCSVVIVTYMYIPIINTAACMCKRIIIEYTYTL